MMEHQSIDHQSTFHWWDQVWLRALQTLNLKNVADCKPNMIIMHHVAVDSSNSSILCLVALDGLGRYYKLITSNLLSYIFTYVRQRRDSQRYQSFKLFNKNKNNNNNTKKSNKQQHQHQHQCIYIHIDIPYAPCTIYLHLVNELGCFLLRTCQVPSTAEFQARSQPLRWWTAAGGGWLIKRDQRGEYSPEI